jgi:anaerobic magnesium-protoporphyrin IX monomethyl ester cyclase
MKILLLNPPFYRLHDASMVHYPPGSCFMASNLERAGYDSLIYNADWTPDKKTIIGNINHLRIKALAEANAMFLRRLDDPGDPVWVEIRDFVRRFRPAVVGISVFNTTLRSGHMAARIVKELFPKAVTFLEGSQNRGFHCAVDPAPVADWSLIDAAIRKEPEVTVVEFIEAIRSGNRDWSEILGLSWKKNGDVVHNPDRPFVENLDELPWPARHKMWRVEEMPPKAHLSIYGSRGCPFKCKYCGGHTSWGYKPRLRSAKHMVDEMEEVTRTYGTRYYYLCDDILLISKPRILEFCDELRARRLNVYWSGQTRAEILDDERLAAMKSAGGQSLSVGVESGSQRILDLVNKGNTVDDVRRCARLLAKHGLRMSAFCMLGLPEETPEDIRATVDLVKEIDPFICFPYLATPAIGTELYDMVQDQSGDVPFENVNYADPAHALSRFLVDEEKRRIIEEAMVELATLNKRKMFLDLFKRPRFWWAYVQDTGVLKHPSHLLDYLRDYFS